LALFYVIAKFSSLFQSITNKEQATRQDGPILSSNEYYLDLTHAKIRILN